LMHCQTGGMRRDGDGQINPITAPNSALKNAIKMRISVINSPVDDQRFCSGDAR
jgi:hypothetical protein